MSQWSEMLGLVVTWRTVDERIISWEWFIRITQVFQSMEGSETSITIEVSALRDVA